MTQKKSKDVPREELDAIGEQASEDLQAKEQSVAEKVVAKDEARRGDKTPGGGDIADDVVAEQAERRKAAANSDEEIASIEAAEEVRLSTETQLPDNPGDKVKVAISDAKVLNLPRAVSGVTQVEVEDGIAEVSPEVAAELKAQYPKQVRIL